MQEEGAERDSRRTARWGLAAAGAVAGAVAGAGAAAAAAASPGRAGRRTPLRPGSCGRYARVPPTQLAARAPSAHAARTRRRFGRSARHHHFVHPGQQEGGARGHQQHQHAHHHPARRRRDFLGYYRLLGVDTEGARRLRCGPPAGAACARAERPPARQPQPPPQPLLGLRRQGQWAAASWRPTLPASLSRRRRRRHHHSHNHSHSHSTTTTTTTATTTATAAAAPPPPPAQAQ